jgi:HSP20 family molecular chaperone IbpA
MSRGYFNSPFLLGFDQIERVLDRVAKTAGDGYPPYNIEQVGEDQLRITLAVAGFAKEDLDVTIEDSQLVISGEQGDEQERTFIHRGIAARKFRRAFVLADGIEIAGASLTNGLLNIDLVRPKPQVSVKRIEIDAGDEAAVEPQATRIKLASGQGEA